MLHNYQALTGTKSFFVICLHFQRIICPSRIPKARFHQLSNPWSSSTGHAGAEAVHTAEGQAQGARRKAQDVPDTVWALCTRPLPSRDLPDRT